MIPALAADSEREAFLLSADWDFYSIILEDKNSNLKVSG
jgi:hypothetical protein